MMYRFVSLFGIFLALTRMSIAQPDQETILSGLRNYATAIDAVPSATFYYQRVFLSPALEQADALQCALKIANQTSQRFGTRNSNSIESFLNQVNENMESLQIENRQETIHEIGLAKDFLCNNQYWSNGRFIQLFKIEGDILTSKEGLSFRNEPSARSRQVSPDYKYLISQLFSWRMALDRIASASVTVWETETGRFCLNIENKNPGNPGVWKSHQVVTQRFETQWVPVSYQTLTDMFIDTLTYENYLVRDGIAVPSTVRHDQKSLQEEDLFRPHEMSYRLLPEGYKLGDPIGE